MPRLKLFLTFIYSCLCFVLQSQTIEQDTLIQKPDTTNTKPSQTFITAEVKYDARDSIIFALDGQKVFLYGDAVVEYTDINLSAYFIELDLAKNEAYACGTVDSLNNEIGLPLFKDKSGEFTMRTMHYNFKTKKAVIEHVVTEQGEGYVVSDMAKKSSKNEFCLKDGKYTTCDNKEHPHFYINLTKAKVIPGKKIITGPAYLVIEDVPFYFIGLPFGFFPTTSSYSSGFLMPSYGEESSRGFFLRDGGYYWAASDYFDFRVTGDIFTNGSWGLRSASTFKKRYKYSGDFNLQYITNLNSEKDLPDFSKSKDFSISYNHRQDSKANPYQNFSASVNFSTSSFDRNNVGSIIRPMDLAQNTKRSSISYSRNWPSTPFNMSSNFLISQQTRDSTISVTLPDLTLTMNRIYPFKSKDKIGSKDRWYELISFSYSGNAQNSITTKENKLLDSNLGRDWKNGIKHSIPVSMNLKFFKYFTASPSVNYNERWYFKSIYKKYSPDNKPAVTSADFVNSDTTSGFYRLYDYNYSVGTSTKLYAFFTPSRKLFGDKINTIRYVLTPNVGLSYQPDFGDPKFGYYDYAEYTDPTTNQQAQYEYSRYDGSIYGIPSKGRSGSMNIGLGNSLEMKVKNSKDSTGFSKIKILESLSINSSYNFLADSLKWSMVSMNARTKIFKTDFNVAASFDPYAIDTTATGIPIRVNRFHYTETGKLLRLESANTSFNYSIGSDTFKKKKDAKALKDQESPIDDINANADPYGELNSPITNEAKSLELGEDGYAKFDIPWNLSFGLNLRLSRGNQFNKEKLSYNKEINADVSVNGTISPTPKWAISFSSGYNLRTKELAHTNINIRRDLHCWSMSFNLVPIGLYKSYFFTISANSSMLKDLKYDKRNSPRDNGYFY